MLHQLHRCIGAAASQRCKGAAEQPLASVQGGHSGEADDTGGCVSQAPTRGNRQVAKRTLGAALHGFCFRVDLAEFGILARKKLPVARDGNRWACKGGCIEEGRPPCPRSARAAWFSPATAPPTLRTLYLKSVASSRGPFRSHPPSHKKKKRCAYAPGAATRRTAAGAPCSLGAPRVSAGRKTATRTAGDSRGRRGTAGAGVPWSPRHPKWCQSRSRSRRQSGSRRAPLRCRFAAARSQRGGLRMPVRTAARAMMRNDAQVYDRRI